MSPCSKLPSLNWASPPYSCLSITRSPPSFIDHLCRQTKSTHLIYGTRYETAARQARVMLEQEGSDLSVRRLCYLELLNMNHSFSDRSRTQISTLGLRRRPRREDSFISRSSYTRPGDKADLCHFPLFRLYRFSQACLHHPLRAHREPAQRHPQTRFLCPSPLSWLWPFLHVTFLIILGMPQNG